jgi:hypothetical protein
VLSYYTDPNPIKMPLYDIEYVIPLTLDQQEKLAIAFTQLHVDRFKTPGTFINVRFSDVSEQIVRSQAIADQLTHLTEHNNLKVFRGGKRRHYNRAVLRTRASENRSRVEYAEHCRDMTKIWDEIVCDNAEPLTSVKRLRSVWVLGALTTALEMGIMRPAVGEESDWLRCNHDEFVRLAEAGDEDAQEMLHSLI